MPRSHVFRGYLDKRHTGPSRGSEKLAKIAITYFANSLLITKFKYCCPTPICLGNYKGSPARLTIVITPIQIGGTYLKPEEMKVEF